MGQSYIFGCLLVSGSKLQYKNTHAVVLVLLREAGLQKIVHRAIAQVTRVWVLIGVHQLFISFSFKVFLKHSSATLIKYVGFSFFLSRLFLKTVFSMCIYHIAF